MKRLLHYLALYGFHLIVVRPVLYVLVGIRFRRLHRLPKGPCLVVANHNSHLDAAVLMTMFPLRRLPRVHPVAAADYFGTSWFRRAVAMACMNGLPIDRKPPRGKDPLVPIVEKMREGETLVFFPEGSRGEAGVVAPFRRGVGLLVRGLPGLLVVPVYLSGPERIWPRGSTLPVPSSIDAHVGVPRTYDPELDAKEIAEQVREDVLALAPPPPPVPGQRSAPPVRVALASIDLAAAREVVAGLVERLRHDGPVLGLSREVLEGDADGVRETTGPVAVGRLRPWLRPLAALARTRGMFPPGGFVRLVERAQTEEVLEHARTTRLVVSDRSAFVDLLAWQVADPARAPLDDAGMRRIVRHLTGEVQVRATRLWGFVRDAPEIGLVHALNLVRPPVPDVLVLVRHDPAEVMERLRSRGQPLREIDNEADLARLQDAYRAVASMLEQWRGVTVLEVPAESADPASIAVRIAEFRRIRTERTAETTE